MSMPLPEERLSEDLRICTDADEADLARLAAFNSIIHGPELGSIVAAMAGHFPGMESGDWIWIEETGKGDVVSSLCLLPWLLRYGSVEIPVGEMGLVGTLEGYRRRGLVRIQIDHFKRRLAERGCLLSFIQGIPYYYRQFGYEYALPLEGGLRMTGRELPDLETAPFTFRLATVEDLPVLQQLYNEAAGDLVISAARDAARWRYLLQHPEATTIVPEYWLVLDASEQIAGYFMLPEHHFYDELSVNEVSRLSFDASLAVLRHCRSLAAERNLPGIRLNLPANTTVARLAVALGAHDMGTYAWQIYIPDLAALLSAIAPVLEERLVASPFAGMTRDLKLCFFRDSLILRFVAGKLVEVTAGGPAQGLINFPPPKFIPLLFGHRTIDQLQAGSPDVSVAGPWRLLVETLFPPVPGFIYSGY